MEGETAEQAAARLKHFLLASSDPQRERGFARKSLPAGQRHPRPIVSRPRPHSLASQPNVLTSLACRAKYPPCLARQTRRAVGGMY
jgi:hypothetical protein